ncbi:helix-turn-helix domain-containing protein [Candidatus Woesebacteria bacterium]|nr:helix-turn-helix domain-containing protein [Candidatus Woesebacteria bacterium]
MKTASEVIKEARLRKKISLARLESETKIKKEFLQAIEEGSWQKLPDFPVVTGFVKNIADFLGINQAHLSAMLRRDYPPKKLVINPKPDVSERFTWTPMLTFYVGAGAIVLFILGYLIFQYSRFIRPPSLSVLVPEEGMVVTDPEMEIIGKTDPDTAVKVNNQPIFVQENGSFSAEIAIYEGTTEIVIIATSRTGKETVIRRTIKPQL